MHISLLTDVWSSLSISLTVGSDSQGHFDLSATDCSFNIDDLSVEFHGGAR